MNQYLKENIHYLVSYFSTLYYVEIVILMVSVLFVYGKILSVAVGLLMAVLLTVQIINVFYKKDRSRKIQLFLMDLHLAYGLAFFINLPFTGYQLNSSNALILTVRSVLVIGELFLIYLLTDKAAAGEFS